MLPDDAIHIATVRSVKPPKRELRLKPTLSEAQLDYLAEVGLEWLWIEWPGATQGKRCRVDQAKLLSGDILVRLGAGISRDKVAQMRGAAVYIEPTAENRELHHVDEALDLTGMTVQKANGQYLGQVVAFMDSPAHPLVRIACEDGQLWLLPCIDEAILDIDADKKMLTVVDDLTPFALLEATNDDSG